MTRGQYEKRIGSVKAVLLNPRRERRNERQLSGRATLCSPSVRRTIDHTAPASVLTSSQRHGKRPQKDDLSTSAIARLPSPA